MTRTWSKINGFPNYSISDDGKVRNDNSGRLKKPIKSTDGYYSVDLYKDGKRTKAKIHRLVGQAYVENSDGKPQINHIDGNKANNDHRNLEWVTPKENMEHAIEHGLFRASRGMLGKKNPNAGRPGKRVRILETGEVFDSILDCERAIGGNNRHICDCLSGRQHTHRGYHFEYV